MAELRLPFGLGVEFDALYRHLQFTRVDTGVTPLMPARGACSHVCVEGELRSREYESKKTNSKQRVWEIRVSSILKLDRAEKSAPEDQDHDEATQEETAA